MLDLVRLEVQEFVAGSFLAGAPMVAVSARTGEGLDELKSELRRLSLEAPPKPADLPFRLPIDRSFVMKGFGAVVTGTLITGTVEKEAEVEIFPAGKARARTRHRGLQRLRRPRHRRPTDGAEPGGNRRPANHPGHGAGCARLVPAHHNPGLHLNLLPSARPLKNHAPGAFPLRNGGDAGAGRHAGRQGNETGHDRLCAASSFRTRSVCARGPIHHPPILARHHHRRRAACSTMLPASTAPVIRPRSNLCASWSRESRKRGLSFWRSGRVKLRPRIWRPAPAGNLRMSCAWPNLWKPKSGWWSSGNPTQPAGPRCAL